MPAGPASPAAATAWPTTSTTARASAKPVDVPAAPRHEERAGRGLRPLPQALPALPRRLGRRRRPDRRRSSTPGPRDYRKGIFKFTSTAGGQKPTRDDLRKTIRYGLHGTSMPAFEALMSAAEIEQVIDYMIFLSVRGETERP